MPLDEQRADNQQTEKQSETPPDRQQSLFSRAKKFISRSLDPDQDRTLWETVTRWGTVVGLILTCISCLYAVIPGFRFQNSASETTPAPTLQAPQPIQPTSDESLVRTTVEIPLTNLDLDENSTSLNFETGKEPVGNEAVDLVISNCCPIDPEEGESACTSVELFCSLYGVALMEVPNPDPDLSRVDPSVLRKRRTGFEGSLVPFQTFVLYAYDGYAVGIRIRSFRLSEFDEEGNAVSAVLFIDYVYPLSNLQRP